MATDVAVARFATQVALPGAGSIAGSPSAAQISRPAGSRKPPMGFHAAAGFAGDAEAEPAVPREVLELDGPDEDGGVEPRVRIVSHVLDALGELRAEALSPHRVSGHHPLAPARERGDQLALELHRLGGTRGGAGDQSPVELVRRPLRGLARHRAPPPRSQAWNHPSLSQGGPSQPSSVMRDAASRASSSTSSTIASQPPSLAGDATSFSATAPRARTLRPPSAPRAAPTRTLFFASRPDRRAAGSRRGRASPDTGERRRRRGRAANALMIRARGLAALAAVASDGDAGFSVTTT